MLRKENAQAAGHGYPGDCGGDLNGANVTRNGKSDRKENFQFARIARIDGRIGPVVQEDSGGEIPLWCCPDSDLDRLVRSFLTDTPKCSDIEAGLAEIREIARLQRIAHRNVLYRISDGGRP